MSRSTAGCSGSASAATPAFPRSAAIVYWVRSLVPTEKKSTSGARWSATSAAEGTSSIMPEVEARGDGDAARLEGRPRLRQELAGAPQFFHACSPSGP